MPEDDAPATGNGEMSLSSRLVLRSFVEEDLETVGPWYQEAVVAADGGTPDVDLKSRWLAAQAETGGRLLVATRRSDSVPIVLIDARLSGPAPGCLVTRLIAVRRAERGLGYGSEAMRWLEDSLATRRLASRFAADVPLSNGLALYFWLRLGYRPCRSEEMRGRRLRLLMRMVRVIYR